jgi:AcrR family transcriptional regulator
LDDLKNLILDKARERFDRFGYKKTTMDEISRDCKISKKTVYEHFQDKENLFHSLLMRETSKARSIIFSRMGEIDDPLERLTLLLRTAIDYFNEESFLTRLLQDDAALFSAFLSDRYHSLIRDEIISMIAGVIQEGKRRGCIRDVDEQVVAYAGFRLFQAFSYMQTTEFCREKEQQGYYTDALIDLITNGIKEKQGQGSR